MARSSNTNDLRWPKHLIPDKLEFSLFTSEDIRRLSVAKIVTPLMLDALGHPLPGGLYDPRMGPVMERGDPCMTCNKPMANCAGHFGHIDLPLPVVNPLFYKIIGTILKMSCFSCFRIQIPVHVKHSISMQLKLLNCGLVTEAIEVDNQIMALISLYESMDKIPEESMKTLTKYDKLLVETLASTKDELNTNKNTEALRNQFINSMLQNMKPHKQCIYCKKPKVAIQTMKKKIIIIEHKGSDRKSKEEAGGVRTVDSRYMTPEESRQFLREIWQENRDFLRNFVSVLNNVDLEHPTDVFYFDVVPVPPPIVRPANFVNGRIMENQQSQTYKSIIQNASLLRTIIQVVKKNGDDSILSSVEAKAAYSYASGNTPVEKLNHCWEELQTDINNLEDNSSRSVEGNGLKQILERKSGVIRMHMMGKRVNYAARSVITPDPNLNIDEIGIPEKFAMHLTYPVPVTPWNVEELRQMVMNGPNVHPGAVLVEFEDGSVIRISSDPQKKEALVKRLLTPDDRGPTGFRGVKIIHRHLRNGDVLLLNRQPTLHRPSIMAHTARILKGEKTLRLHYANCKAYNADFDGDEMNAHFPQSELARSEGYFLANVSNQYLVPKDGTPLSGLIQDHMIAGVRMSLRGRFFNRDDYNQLVFQGLPSLTSKIILLPPCIIKPIELWSGKQVLSTVIINIIPKDSERINLISTAKISDKAWISSKPRPWKAGGSPFKNSNIMSEAEVVIRGGELLVGILDKTHYGSTPYSLIHCMYELYGGIYASKLLSAFAKVFTRFLQQDGFTLGVKDILTIDYADKKRRKVMKKSRQIGIEVMTTVLNLPQDTPLETIVDKIDENRQNNLKFNSFVDRQYKTSLDSFTNDINTACLPAGLVTRFPYNNLQLMVQSGAKGSTVNTMQISCLLGQIELEGKRPPIMICGKSLPSFPTFEFSPRAGGFIDGRFMTGIQPQEFFFHCMAGREGLIDTAVKTSRSGYLQRCLIKHLEGLKVNYDMTVRDSDQSVIQFLYGEDGMDISKVQFLNSKQFEFLRNNNKAILQKDIIKELKKSEGQTELKQHNKKISNWREENGSPFKCHRESPFAKFCTVIKQKFGETREISKDQMVELWRKADDDIKKNFKEQCRPCPDPLNVVFQPDHHFGSLNERLETLLDTCLQGIDKKTKKKCEDMLKIKAMQSYCAAGEPVGLLAAQSIGEPSTQMTLNTFHFAGRGEMNVTLGIPRLREILMMASKNIKTPSMEIPFLNVPNLTVLAEDLRKTLTKVVVKDVLEKIDVTLQLVLHANRQYQYTLKFCFLPHQYYKEDYRVTPKFIMKHMRKRFFAEMFAAIRKFSKINSKLVHMDEEKTSKKPRKANIDDEDEDVDAVVNQVSDNESSDNEVEDQEDAKTTKKFSDLHEDQEPEDEEKLVSSEDEEDEEKQPVQEEKEEEMDEEGISVLHSYSNAQNYVYDKKKHEWCELTFNLPLSYGKLDLTAILKSCAEKSILWETPNIKKAITYMKDDTLTLRTDGININEMFKYKTLLNLNALYCNDIHKVAETYGIEAAGKSIVKEVKDVFNVYGIKVDPRHLSLIADYMTFNGTFEPLSRKGMETSASPLQQMSFESSMTFLKSAIIRGREDDLRNPSSSLMVGKPCESGTGAFTLLQKLPQFLK